MDIFDWLCTVYTFNPLSSNVVALIPGSCVIVQVVHETDHTLGDATRRSLLHESLVFQNNLTSVIPAPRLFVS